MSGQSTSPISDDDFDPARILHGLTFLQPQLLPMDQRQAAQTFTWMLQLPAAGANHRVYKTVANGSALQCSSINIRTNTVTVAAVTFDRTVKLNFDGAVESMLLLECDDSDCVGTTPPPSVSLINACSDFTPS